MLSGDESHVAIGTTTTFGYESTLMGPWEQFGGTPENFGGTQEHFAGTQEHFGGILEQFGGPQEHFGSLLRASGALWGAWGAVGGPREHFGCLLPALRSTFRTLENTFGARILGPLNPTIVIKAQNVHIVTTLPKPLNQKTYFPTVKKNILFKSCFAMYTDKGNVPLHVEEFLSTKQEGE